MYAQMEKTKEDKNRSAANSVGQKKSSGRIGFGIVDNRPEAITQRKLQEMANKHSASQLIQKKENNTGLPDNLKAGIKNLSSYSMDDVKVHYNSPKPPKLQAHAYAQGTDIHLAPRQEKHLPHEAWHVAQQKQGWVKPTMQMKGGVNINDDEGLEKEADVMGAKSIQRYAQKEKTKERKSSTVTNSIAQNKKNSATPSGVIQKITFSGYEINIEILNSQGCRRHLNRIARINAGHPQPGDNQYTYAPGDQAALQVRRTEAQEEEREVRRQNLVVALIGRLGTLATGAAFNGAQPWVGANNPVGQNIETYAAGRTPATEIAVVNRWNAFLQNNTPYHHLHPRTGGADNTRLVAANGERSIRYGNHERTSPANLHHFHEEQWSDDGAGNVDIANEVRRTPVR